MSHLNEFYGLKNATWNKLEEEMGREAKLRQFVTPAVPHVPDSPSTTTATSITSDTKSVLTSNTDMTATSVNPAPLNRAINRRKREESGDTCSDTSSDLFDDETSDSEFLNNCETQALLGMSGALRNITVTTPPNILTKPHIRVRAIVQWRAYKNDEPYVFMFGSGIACHVNVAGRPLKLKLGGGFLFNSTYYKNKNRDPTVLKDLTKVGVMDLIDRGGIPLVTNKKSCVKHQVMGEFGIFDESLFDSNGQIKPLRKMPTNTDWIAKNPCKTCGTRYCPHIDAYNDHRKLGFRYSYVAFTEIEEPNSSIVHLKHEEYERRTFPLTITLKDFIKSGSLDKPDSIVWLNPKTELLELNDGFMKTASTKSTGTVSKRSIVPIKQFDDSEDSDLC